MNRKTLEDKPIRETQRRRSIEILRDDVDHATPDDPALHCAIRRIKGAVRVRVIGSRIYLLTTGQYWLRYVRPRGHTDRPGVLWLDPVPARHKATTAPPQAPAQPEPVVITAGGLPPGAKQTAMALVEVPGRSFRDCAQEILQNHVDRLKDSLEVAFVARLQHSPRHTPTSRQRKLLRELCERCGVPLWHGALPWVVAERRASA